MLTQLYVDSGDDRIELDDTDLWAALQDLVLLFLLYVQETEEEHSSVQSTLDAFASMAQMFIKYVESAENTYGGDFRQFLRERALEAYGGGEPDAIP